MARKKSKSPKGQKGQPKTDEKKKEQRITMQALDEMSDDSSDEDYVPFSGWSTKAKNLRKEIEGGKFDKVLDVLENAKKNDEDEFEEDSLGSSGDEEDENKEDEIESEKNSASGESAEVTNEQEEEAESEEEEREGADKIKEIFEKKKDGSDEEENSDSSSESDNDNDDNERSENSLKLIKNNHVNSKALAVATAELVASHSHLPWAETFDIVPPTPLPFGTKPDIERGTSPLDIHDDLKREVAFYNCALEAVHKARAECKKAQIPFTRQDDFFAEMIKTDDHMAKVKDRLIFETKKMDAVAQRKSNREQKLRAKESHANKLAEKSKRKREHFQEVEEWANAAARNRGGALRDDADDKFLQRGQNKKREAANRKYGFGGKTGRFKQNDKSSMNDMSGYNPRGNFPGGMKKTAKNGAGAARAGKRARDAKRSRR